MPRIGALVLGILALFSTPLAAEEATLRGSPASMLRQNGVAREQDYTFLRTGSQVRDFVERGYLVPVEASEDFELARVSYPYARPELALFVERLASQYREGCGEKLVVTSLTRPRSAQPANSHDLSVHPTGMAVDLRVSDTAACRQWLESALLSLEGRAVLDVTRERHPPHYHVAVFPEAYAAHAAVQIAADSARAAEAALHAGPAETLLPAALAAGFVARTDEPREPRAGALAFLASVAIVAGAARLWPRRGKRR